MKKVSFNLNKNINHTTYSSCEYHRFPIDSVIYLRSYKRISDKEWREIIDDLNKYKLTEMIIHKDSITNTKFG